MISRAHRRRLNRALHELRRPLQALALMDAGEANGGSSRDGLMELARSALDAIDAELEWLCLPGSSTLSHAGDEGDALYVVTSGGLVGRVAKLGDSFLHVEVANGVELQVQRNAVVQVLPKGTVK